MTANLTNRRNRRSFISKRNDCVLRSSYERKCMNSATTCFETSMLINCQDQCMFRKRVMCGIVNGLESRKIRSHTKLIMPLTACPIMSQFIQSRLNMGAKFDSLFFMILEQLITYLYHIGVLQKSAFSNIWATLTGFYLDSSVGRVFFFIRVVEIKSNRRLLAKQFSIYCVRGLINLWTHLY